MFPSSGDVLLTHGVTWITEEEFQRNKNITNSTITTSSYFPVVWNQKLFESYNDTFGLVSTFGFNGTKYIDGSEHSVEHASLSSNTVSVSQYQGHDNFYSTTFNMYKFPLVSATRSTVPSLSPAEVLMQGFNDIHSYSEYPSQYKFLLPVGMYLHNSHLNTEFYGNNETSQSSSTDASLEHRIEKASKGNN